MIKDAIGSIVEDAKGRKLEASLLLVTLCLLGARGLLLFCVGHGVFETGLIGLVRIWSRILLQASLGIAFFLVLKVIAIIFVEAHWGSGEKAEE